MEENIQQPEEQQEKKKMTVKNLLNNKRALLIIAITCVVLLITIFALIAGRKEKNRSVSTNPTPSVNLTYPEASVYFDPPTVNATPGQAKSIEIYVDTWGREISGVNIAIKYNPNVISNVTLTQFRDRTSTVSLALEASIANNDTGIGIIELPLVMASTTPMQKGRGRVAVLTFTTKPTNITQATMTFATPTTLITKTAQKVIVLQKGTLKINYPIDGVFPTIPPQTFTK